MVRTVVCPTIDTAGVTAAVARPLVRRGVCHGKNVASIVADRPLWSVLASLGRRGMGQLD